MPSEANDAALTEVGRKLQAILDELRETIEPGEGGDGRLWMVAGFHTPDMPQTAVYAQSTLGWDESQGAARLLSEAFEMFKNRDIRNVAAMGFSEHHAAAIVAMLGLRQHLQPMTPPSIALAHFDALVAHADGTVSPEARRPIEVILNDMVKAQQKAMLEAAVDKTRSN